jgi:hypothetical protein
LICRDCGEEFNEKNPINQVGYINQCRNCANDVERHIGRRVDSKHGGIEIFRENHEFVKSVVGAEARGGFYPKIPLGAPTNVKYGFGKPEDVTPLNEYTKEKPTGG